MPDAERDIENKTLAELKEKYTKALHRWQDRHKKLQEQVEECEREMKWNRNKLRSVLALTGDLDDPENPIPLLDLGWRGTGVVRRTEAREAIMTVIRDNPDRKLSATEVSEAIDRHPDYRGWSRQAINDNLAILTDVGLLRREQAPAGSLARYVFTAVENPQVDETEELWAKKGVSSGKTRTDD